jgi:hypothetical protein
MLLLTGIVLRRIEQRALLGVAQQPLDVDIVAHVLRVDVDLLLARLVPERLVVGALHENLLRSHWMLFGLYASTSTMRTVYVSFSGSTSAFMNRSGSALVLSRRLEKPSDPWSARTGLASSATGSGGQISV